MDVYKSDGRYLRAFGGFVEPVIVSVTQQRADALAVSVSGSVGDGKGARKRAPDAPHRASHCWKKSSGGR